MLSDDDRMSFGKYQGQKLGDVPAGYLIWCNDQPWIQDPSKAAFRDYIERNWDALKQEADDHERELGRGDP